MQNLKKNAKLRLKETHDIMVKSAASVVGCQNWNFDLDS